MFSRLKRTSTVWFRFSGAGRVKCWGFSMKLPSSGMCLRKVPGSPALSLDSVSYAKSWLDEAQQMVAIQQEETKIVVTIRWSWKEMVKDVSSYLSSCLSFRQIHPTSICLLTVTQKQLAVPYVGICWKHKMRYKTMNCTKRHIEFSCLL